MHGVSIVNLSEMHKKPKFSLIKPEIWSRYGNVLNERRQLRILTFAQLWAEGMEREICAGNKLKDVAGKMRDSAKQDTMITDENMPLAVEILGKVWAHGPELLAWYKAQDD